MQYLWLGLLAAAIWTYVVAGVCDSKNSRARIMAQAIAWAGAVLLGYAVNLGANAVFPNSGGAFGVLVGFGFIVFKMFEIDRRHPASE